MDADGVVDRSFKVIQINEDVVMAEGQLIENGVFGKDVNTYYKVYENGELAFVQPIRIVLTATHLKAR